MTEFHLGTHNALISSELTRRVSIAYRTDDGSKTVERRFGDALYEFDNAVRLAQVLFVPSATADTATTTTTTAVETAAKMQAVAAVAWMIDNTQTVLLPGLKRLSDAAVAVSLTFSLLSLRAAHQNHDTQGIQRKIRATQATATYLATVTAALFLAFIVGVTIPTFQSATKERRSVMQLFDFIPKVYVRHVHHRIRSRLARCDPQLLVQQDGHDGLFDVQSRTFVCFAYDGSL